MDGKPHELGALVYRSAALAQAGGPRPVVIALYTPPGSSQSGPGFDPFVQYLINELGLVVVSPTLRDEPAGTDELREETVRDVGSLLVWIDCSANWTATASRFGVRDSVPTSRYRRWPITAIGYTRASPPSLRISPRWDMLQRYADPYCWYRA